MVVTTHVARLLLILVSELPLSRQKQFSLFYTKLQQVSQTNA